MRTWTPPSGWTAGEKPPASRLDTDVRDNLLSAGEWHFVELAPQRSLTGMLKKINRRLAVESLATAEALAK